MSGGSSRSGSGMKWTRPYATSAAKSAQDVFNANQGANQQMASTVQNLVPGLVSKYTSGNPTVNAAQGYASDVLSGKYLTGNPHLQGIIDATKGDVTDSVNSQFSLAGRYGSGGHTGVLAQQLAEAENGLRYGDYNAQMGRMDSMASQAPALAQAEYLPLEELLKTAGVGAELPYSGLQAYGGVLGNLFNGGVNKTSALGNIAGALGSGLGAAASLGAFK